MLGCLPFLVCTHVSGGKQQFWGQAGKSLREPQFDGVEGTGEDQSWIDTGQCCDGELEAAAITVARSNSLLVVFFLLVITLGLKMWGQNLDSVNPQNQQMRV